MLAISSYRKQRWVGNRLLTLIFKLLLSYCDHVMWAKGLSGWLKHHWFPIELLFLICWMADPGVSWILFSVLMMTTKCYKTTWICNKGLICPYQNCIGLMLIMLCKCVWCVKHNQDSIPAPLQGTRSSTSDCRLLIEVHIKHMWCFLSGAV